MSELLNHAIATVNRPEMAAVETPNAMQLIQQAMADGKGDMVRELVSLQQSIERFSWEREERQAKVDFDDALNRCQSRMKRIGADMTNPQTHSKYASYAALDRAIRPVYTGEGFSISFGEDEGSTADYIVMLAFLSRAGHTRTYRKGMPIDTKGPKGNDVMTKTHAAGSGGSYAKRYLLKDIFNLAIGEDDDDGDLGVVEKKDMPMERFAFNMERIEGAKTLKELQMAYVNAYKEADTYRDEAARDNFIAAKDARKADIECE